MTVLQALLLGALQGLTEFLPVSSSGHLALAQMLIPGFSQPGVVFDAVLHLGTAAAVVWFERRRIRQWLHVPVGRRLLMLLVLGTAATAAVALPVRGMATAAFSDPVWVGAALLVTACVVVATRWLPGGDVHDCDTSWQHAAVIGVAQGLAVFPGLSRSGMTIAAGLGSGLDRSWAAHFSFLLSVPAILAATAVEIAGSWSEVVDIGTAALAPYVIGCLCAGLTGFVALRVVVSLLSSHAFHRFSWYCAALGLAVLGWRILA
jgi:undecaprenyl-diphosphatase